MKFCYRASIDPKRSTSSGRSQGCLFPVCPAALLSHRDVRDNSEKAPSLRPVAPAIHVFPTDDLSAFSDLRRKYSPRTV
jgi:hypothetical protein